MKAPEKIYIDDFGSEFSQDWHTEHSYEKDIEYTRADAFIEKALKWYCLDCECNDRCKDTKCFFYREYEHYLKGVTNAIPPKFTDRILNEDGSTSENWRYRHFISKIQDAFIEKACEFIEQSVTGYIDVTHKGGDENITLQSEFVNDFKEFMKGE